MELIPVKVTGISICSPFQGYVVILKEEEGKKWLPIFIGVHEAHNISLLLQGLKYLRPLTYDLFHNLLQESGAVVQKVTINDLRDNTFYAEVLLRVTGNAERKVDARPSDAVALAIKTKAPIFVHKHVLDEAGLVEGEQPDPQPELNDRLEELKLQLKEVVEREAYEDAARLRDQIKTLEAQRRKAENISNLR